jgi:hypothetical protein
MRWSALIAIAALAGWLPAGAADASPVRDKEARALYDIKCAKCHKFYHPADYTQADWDTWMRKMSRKSRLKPAQDKLLTEWLQAFRDNGSAAPRVPGK